MHNANFQVKVIVWMMVCLLHTLTNLMVMAWIIFNIVLHLLLIYWMHFTLLITFNRNFISDLNKYDLKIILVTHMGLTWVFFCSLFVKIICLRLHLLMYISILMIMLYMLHAYLLTSFQYLLEVKESYYTCKQNNLHENLMWLFKWWVN